MKPAIGTGCTDQPAFEDQFKIEKYINGLSTFILNCNTPMTLAIQGDWGTGKTSVMQMVRKKLQENATIQDKDIWYNTWQFSQFEMEDRLPLMLMSKLLRSVGGKDRASTKEAVRKVFGVIGDIAVGYLSGGAANADALKEREENLVDFVDKIETLKADFQALISEKAGPDGRVVIFVDDLDRLQPEKAVELLEILKIFLDCEKCVFVLAIDYGVVSRGVKEKYGADFSEDKAKSFFDKIIQVPFKMPVADYNIGNYVRNNLERIGVTVRDEDQLRTFVDLIERSIGNNPRSMKRLFNSFLLLRGIADDAVTNDPHNEEILFALLCMQSKYEKVYNYFMKHKEAIDEAFLNRLAQGEDDSLFEELGIEGENEQASFTNFAGAFFEVIDKDGTKKVDGKELEAFQNVLAFSSITSTDSVQETSVKTRGSVTVNSLSDLNMPYKSLEEKEKLCDLLREVDPAVYIKLVNANSGYSYISGRTSREGREFASIEDRQNGYICYCETPSAKYFAEAEAYPEITRLVTQLGKAVGRRPGKNFVTVRVRSGEAETEQYLRQLLRMCYELSL